jgi:hypothetical protein
VQCSGLENRTVVKEGSLMEKLAKKEKKPIAAKVNEADVQQIGGWLGLLLSKIKSVPAAEEKWRALTAAGLDQEEREEVAEYLFRYCGGTQEQLKAGFKAACNFRDALQPAAVEVNRTNSEGFARNRRHYTARP